MSGPLVPSGAQFSQQGSVDWVALSNTSVQFSVAVLSRLSRAGIDAFTLQVGRAICFNFALEPHGQERMSDAILKLKRYGSYGDLIWFGFGIKEVVTDLADTEEGLTLVAVCAALSTTYEPLFAAKVLRELCVLCKAPQSFSPALRQWKALVELCAGILGSAHFVMLVNGFRRLISGSSPDTVGNRCTPTTPSALAEAILILARISKRCLVNAVFSGGLDCAWLAAFAEWILSLDVGICDLNGSYLYRSRGSVSSLPSITILLSGTTGVATQDSLLRSKTSLVPNGQSLLQKDPALRGISILNWQGSWSTILHDVFHSNIDALLDGDTGLHFANLLKCMSTLQGHNDKDLTLISFWSNHPVNPLLIYYSNGGDHGYLEFAARRLPELSACWPASSPLQHKGTAEMARGALQAIEKACLCAFHDGRTGKEIEGDNRVCLRTMAEAIVVYLWILIGADIDDDVLPSITGLANLYSWQSHSNKSPGPADGPWYQSMMGCDYPALGIDLIFHVLSGISVLGTPPKAEALPTIESLARVGNGICVYYYAVEDPNLPPESIFRVHIVRGYISYTGCRYQDLCGLKNASMTEGLRFDDFCGKPKIRSVQTLIQESDEQGLEMAYLLHYLAKDGRNSTHWLHLPLLLRKLQRIARTRYCEHTNRALDESTFSVRLLNPLSYDDIIRSMSRDSVDNPQRFLDTLGDRSSIWILLGNSKVCIFIVGQPLLLYGMIRPSGQDLYPFTKCLYCVLDMALDHGYVRRPTSRTPCAPQKYIGEITLLSSSLSTAVVSWEEIDKGNRRIRTDVDEDLDLIDQDDYSP